MIRVCEFMDAICRRGCEPGQKCVREASVQEPPIGYTMDDRVEEDLKRLTNPERGER